jgi:hypothetical protein
MTDPGAGTSPPAVSRRRAWQIVFWFAVLLPLAPSLLIYAIAEIANARGCMAAAADPCIVGPFSMGTALSRAIRFAAGMGTLIGFGVPLVLALAYLGLELGFRRLAVRLVLALLACLLVSFLPLVGPATAMEGLTHPGCRLNEGGVGDCTLFGVAFGQEANALLVMGWFFLVAGPLALLTFLAYVIIALVLRARARLLPG